MTFFTTTFSFFSISWLAEQLFVWLVLTVAVSFCANWWRLRTERKETEEFTGWSLVLVGDDEPDDHQSLHWQEVQQFISSDFERWKLVKSVVSGYGRLTIPKIKPAEESGWTYLDENDRNLVIDFNKLPCEHLVGGKWTTAPKRLADDARCPK